VFCAKVKCGLTQHMTITFNVLVHNVYWSPGEAPAIEKKNTLLYDVSDTHATIWSCISLGGVGVTVSGRYWFAWHHTIRRHQEEC